MDRSPCILSFQEPHELGRVIAFCGNAPVGRIYPLGDGRATWALDLTDDRGTARSVQAAQDALSEAFGRWLSTARLGQT
ncbi:hypothetical protein A7A09_008825 [Paracoccus methylarcula]|uniref:Uncharacterized protein n=1 Tax=Paracoccus methylarcula TaxID=72022 RepID=A0A3R7PQE6_9RHOB|nr:hypothetical protein A7A09_008825 [Paracoccus methylarcula]